MSIDLVVDQAISTTLEAVKDQTGKQSALAIATDSAKVESTKSGKDVQLEVSNPKDGEGQVAGLRFYTASGWNVMLRTNSGGAWLELTDGNGKWEHRWYGGNYTAKGDLAVQGNAVTFSGLKNLPASGTTDLTIDSTGKVAPQTSSARFKENIEPLHEDFHKILSADPVSFVNKATGDQEIGYIAEDFHENNLQNLVSYDAEGKPLSVDYKLLSVYNLEIIKEQQQVIHGLQEELVDIKKRLPDP